MAQEQTAEITAVSGTFHALAPLDLEVRLGQYWIEAKTYWYRGHSRADLGKYRLEEEAAEIAPNLQLSDESLAEIDIWANGGSAWRT